jgi:hypothetical protein
LFSVAKLLRIKLWCPLENALKHPPPVAEADALVFCISQSFFFTVKFKVCLFPGTGIQFYCIYYIEV